MTQGALFLSTIPTTTGTTKVKQAIFPSRIPTMRPTNERNQEGVSTQCIPEDADLQRGRHSNFRAQVWPKTERDPILG